MIEEKMKADVLCIGGGPAGLMAAIRAGELGANVIVADKANTLHSGSGSAGNDHFMCYIPDVHGKDIKPLLDELKRQPLGARRPEFGQRVLEESFDIVKLWDGWGIPMKYKGKWEFAGHAFPGRPLMWLKYAGGNQKRVLTEQALKRGARIVNRVNVFEVLVDKGRAVGALGLDTWNDQIIEFQAKAVFLGTGGCGRLYPASTPGWMFNLPMCPYVTGDGRSMVYRAGGELHDMEHIGQWAGIKYFARAGKATWIGVLRGPDDKPIGPFVTKPDRVYGDITSDCWSTVFDDYMKTGKGPVYMDCRGASKEDLDYMRYWLLQEGNKGILDNMAEEGIDPGRHAIEFRSYDTHLRGGVRYNLNGETSVKGLFAAGQEYFGHMAIAVIYGWLAGENAARYASEGDFGDISTAREKAGERLGLIEDILSRDEGATWKEANFAVQQIMAEYAGGVRSETLLDQGLLNLTRLREKVAGTLMARNGHELGRCLEVLSLLDVGELVMLCARERRETRANHRRTDYPFTNPLLDKALVIRKEAGKPVLEWKEYE
jgi:succinate dehydrogenase/fumarate reductase flavoprotein subunit